MVGSWFAERHRSALKGALAFVPWVVQQSYAEGMLDSGSTVVHRGEGAVVFSDASGFTALTERLALKSNGAELLSQCLMGFFTPLINIIEAYRGDVIKFSGDALTIYYPAVDDTKHPRARPALPPHGSFGVPDLGPMATSVLRASASCIEIHKRLHMFDTGVDGVKLCLHIGVGCGEVSVLQVGGEIPPETHIKRYEYVIAGGPIEQISVAEPLAKNGETVLSPQAWVHAKKCVIEGAPIKDEPTYHQLARMDERKYTFPTIKNAAMEADSRYLYKFGLGQLDVLRRYIPSAVFKQIQGGTLTYVNEMRNISTIFIQVAGVDVSSEQGSSIAQQLMTSVQRFTYKHEGTLNKFLVDDKGLLFLLVFGLPPLVHMDDPTRAILCCFDLVQLMSKMDLTGRFGVTTGKNYCGVVGSPSRMEYTVLGDTVNLSARLMANASPLGILACENTQNLAKDEIFFDALQPIKVKGKTALIPIFRPLPQQSPNHIGLCPDLQILFPWRCEATFVSGRSKFTELRNSMEVVFVRRLLGETNAPLPIAGGNWSNLGKASRGLHSRGMRTTMGKEKTVTFTGRKSIPTDSAIDTSLFHDGGVLVITGALGLGRTELCELISTKCVGKFQMALIFGTIGPRPNERMRPVRELLKSCLSSLRHADTSMPRDDQEALKRLAPPELASSLRQAGPILNGEVGIDDDAGALEKGLDIAVMLVRRLLEKHTTLAVLSLDTGTNLYDKTMAGDIEAFWRVVCCFAEFAKPSLGRKPLVLVISCCDSQVMFENEAVQLAWKQGWYLETRPLSEDGIAEYISKCLEVHEQQVPKPLTQFVAKITLGNALYIRETIDQLIQHGHVEVFRTASGTPEGLYHNQDLESITIAEWAHTAMVGSTICLLESLDPLPAAVVKMSTVFSGCFTVADLISSCCSRWSGATCLDALRLYQSVQSLVAAGILDVSTPSPVELSIAGERDYYRLHNVLVRKVAGAMLLDQQKKAIKRQALMDRCLAKDLPSRMEVLNKRKAVPHVPWYYQVYLPNRRGMSIIGQ